MQEIQSGGIMISQQLKELNLKLTQQLTINRLTYALTWFSQISQTLLSTEEHILLFMKIVTNKLPLLRPGLELNTFHLINAMSGIMQKLMLME